MAEDGRHARLRVDLHLAGGGAVAERAAFGGEAVLAAQGFAARLREPRHFRQRDGAIGALHRECARFVADVVARRLQHLAGERAPALDHRFRPHHACGSADPHGPGPVRSPPLLHSRGIAVDEAHRVEVDAEPVGRDLRVGGLVTHAEVLGSGEHGDRAVRVRFDLRVVGGDAAVVLDVGGGRDAAQPAARGRLRAPRFEPRHVDGVDGAVEVRPEVAPVVDEAARRGPRHVAGGDEVAPPDLDAVDAGRAGGGVDERFGEVVRLHPPDTAVRGLRRGVARVAAHLDVAGGNAVGASHGRDQVVGHRREAARRYVGAVPPLDERAHRGEPPVRVDGDGAVQQVVARLRVGEEALGAGCGPVHGSAGALRRREEHGELGVRCPACAEAAARVRHHDAQPRRLDAEHGGEVVAHAVRGLAPEGQGPGTALGVVARDGGSGLKEHRGDAVVCERHLHDVGGGRERGVGRLAVSLLAVEGDVAGIVLPHRHGRRARLLVRRHRRQGLVLDGDRVGRIERLCFALGDDHRHRFACVPCLRGRERRLAGVGHRRAVPIQPRERRDAGKRRDGADLSPDVPTGEDAQHSVHRSCRRGVHVQDPSMRMRRAHHHRPRGAGLDQVVGEPAPAGEEAMVLLACDPPSDPTAAHGSLPGSRHPCAAADRS